MKKPISTASIFFTILFFLAGCGPSSVVVRTQPPPPFYVRPASPGGNYVVDGDWIRRGHGYEFRQGYWAAPRQRYHRYISGHWKQKKHGWYWVPGHWN